MTDTRPREFASVISDKVTELIREELESVPKELRLVVADEVVSGVWLEWELRKLKAKK